VLAAADEVASAIKLDIAAVVSVDEQNQLIEMLGRVSARVASIVGSSPEEPNTTAPSETTSAHPS